ncbi:response regulator [Geomonas limicola]|uniref:Response regulator n=1 Tax=Geomonas limicola TaxID=2740186 RepID=A0A6V8N3W7_9BACT|nr:response regulator [Geomonas limicola]GFO66674.1 response regulator [Geomonas limicola]
MDNLSVLLVEDNVDDEWLALRALRKAGMQEVAVVRDGCEAISWLSSAARNVTVLPDLVLLDLKLPKMDGVEVLRKLRSEAATSRLNVVIVSSSEEPHVLATCRSLGVLGCFQKPLTTQSLSSILQLLPGPVEGAVAV